MENNGLQQENVYIQAADNIYHIDSVCAGKGYSTVNIALAEAQIRTQCPTCAGKNLNIIATMPPTMELQKQQPIRQEQNVPGYYNAQANYGTTQPTNNPIPQSKKQSFLQSLKNQVSSLIPKGVCFICQQETSFKCVDDYICTACVRKHLPYKISVSVPKLTKTEIQSYIRTDKISLNTYVKSMWKPTKKVINFFEVNETTKQWVIPNCKNKKVYSFDDIVTFELLEDGSSIIKGGVGMATVGATIFGAIGGAAAIGAGATVGSILGKKKKNKVVTELKVKITVNNMNTPALYIVLLNKKTKSDSNAYKSSFKNAQEILSILSIMVDRKSKTTPTPTAPTSTIPPQKVSAVSPADEIRKYKNLLDDGIITKEEFETKKKVLLKLD